MPAHAEVKARRSLADGYREDIEELIGEDLVPEALDKLQDFARDLAPELKNEALMLRREYSSFVRDLRRNLVDRDGAGPIVARILDLTTEVYRGGGAAETDLPTGGGPAAMLAAFQTDQASLGPSAGHDGGQSRPSGYPRIEMAPGPARIASASSVLSPHAGLTRPLEPANDAGPVGLESLDELRRLYWRRFRDSRPPEESIAFECRDITKRYRSGGFRLGNLSFQLRAGEITGVVGRNASGKTTLLRMVLGELLPDSGTTAYPLLTRDGASWAHIKRQIAYVPQLPERWHGRLRNNLNFVAAAYGARGKRNRDLVDWHIERYRLSEYEDQTWDRISGGYKIRFELVRALVSRPRLLVLDEPLAYLDVIARQDFLRDLQAIAASLENPVPVIVTSQHLYEIEAVADQMIILDGGDCIYTGSLADIGAQVPYRMVEVTLRAAQRAVQTALADANLQLIEPTMEGYILGFSKAMAPGQVYNLLYQQFGERLIAFRDITMSARSLFNDKAARTALTPSASRPRDAHAAVEVPKD